MINTITNFIEGSPLGDLGVDCCVNDTTEMTEAQKLILENIANQLPLIGGNAVYQARAILGLEVMDDYSNLRIRNSQNHSTSNVSRSNVFYPNPANYEIKVNYNCEGDCIVEIYDLTGS